MRLGDDLARRHMAEIVLVDPNPTHLWKPLLHEVAAGTLIGEESGLDFLQQAKRHHFRFHLGTMVSLDRKRKEVRLAPLHEENGFEVAPERSLWYDILVIAIGSQDNDFGIPGVREHALPLNSKDDAERFHRRLLALMAREEIVGGGPFRIVIVGGGATGVELAAELADATRVLSSYGARIKESPEVVRIHVVENGPRLLPALPEFIGEQAASDLAGRGVDILLGQRVTEVRAGAVVLSDGSSAGKIDADLIVWAAGIRCHDVLADLDGLEANRLNQLVVLPTLQTSRDEHVFAIGDCSSCTPAGGGAPPPPKAQAAHQEAEFLARALTRRSTGGQLPNFAFEDRGSLVSLGQHKAVGNMLDRVRGRTLIVEGLLARISYWLLYRRHLATVVGFGQAALITLIGWFYGRVQPKVKLH